MFVSQRMATDLVTVGPETKLSEARLLMQEKKTAKVQLYMFQEGNFMTDHHVLIANKAAHVITGGEISKPTWVDEQYILDLEREAFLSLCGEEKTQERMWHFLRTGKPLFN